MTNTNTDTTLIPDARDALSQDDVLMLWERTKTQLAELKEKELDWRKYVVKRAFPQKQEGTNTVELGNGYTLKAAIKFNYKLASNDIIEKTLDAIAKIGNEGSFVSERLVSWSPSFLLTEYRVLQEQAESGNDTAQQILAKIGEMLIVDEAAPTVEIKSPKKAKV